MYGGFYFYMKLDSDERLVVEQMRNLAGGDLNTSQVNSFLKSLMMIVLCDFAENESTKIPYFGELKIKYLGDKITDKGRIADLDIGFIPSPTLVRNVGQLVDVKDSKCDTKITDVECIKDVMKDIGNKLNEIMEENS
jgi:hypothetical protein